VRDGDPFFSPSSFSDRLNSTGRRPQQGEPGRCLYFVFVSFPSYSINPCSKSGGVGSCFVPVFFLPCTSSSSIICLLSLLSVPNHTKPRWPSPIVFRTNQQRRYKTHITLSTTTQLEFRQSDGKRAHRWRWEGASRRTGTRDGMRTGRRDRDQI